MEKSLICTLIFCFGIASGNIRQVLIPGAGGPVSPYYGQHCDVICNEETHAATTVCATDGMLYKSECEYKNAQCKAVKGGDILTMVSYGGCVTLSTPCNLVAQTKCIPHQISLITGISDGYEAICGSNNKTYGSTCEFRAAQCKYEQLKYDPLTVTHTGECKVDTTNLIMVNCSKYIMSTSGLAIEGGNVYPHIQGCPKEYHPICSMDGRTFSNACSMCNYLLVTHHLPTNTFVTYALHEGRCTSVEVIG